MKHLSLCFAVMLGLLAFANYAVPILEWAAMPCKDCVVLEMEFGRCIAHSVDESALFIRRTHCKSKLSPAMHTAEAFLTLVYLHDTSSI